jgi:outer membrane immunogenic protein
MKKTLLAGLALGALIAPAMAADMAPAPYYPAPIPVPVVWSWTGLYIGANLGWAGSSNNLTNTGTDTGTGGLGSALAAGFIPGIVGVSHNGFIGGGQIGYNWQLGPFWVAGIEADFDGLGNNSNTSVFAFPGNLVGAVPFTTTFTSGLDTLGTVRARLGWLWTPALLAYATGGFAYGDTKIGSSFTCPTCAPPAAVAISTSNTATGWTIGAGLEWRFAPAWSVKAEYLYVDLGSRSDTITYNYGPTSTLTSTVHEQDNIVRAGLNYKFW